MGTHHAGKYDLQLGKQDRRDVLIIIALMEISKLETLIFKLSLPSIPSENTGFLGKRLLVFAGQGKKLEFRVDARKKIENSSGHEEMAASHLFRGLFANSSDVQPVKEEEQHQAKWIAWEILNLKPVCSKVLISILVLVEHIQVLAVHETPSLSPPIALEVLLCVSSEHLGSRNIFMLETKTT